MQQPAKWKALLADPDFRRWYDNLARGSLNTANENARVLYRLCEKLGTTPQALVALGKAKPRDVFNLMADLVTTEERAGIGGGSANNYLKTAKNWLAFNDVSLPRWPKVRGAEDTRVSEQERIPEKDELRAILARATLRGRACIVLLAYSGVRPEVLGNRQGQDGLRLRDLPDLQVQDRRVKWRNTPALVSVRKELSKAKNRYLTFLPAEGCEALSAYLERRMADGEELTPESPVIRATPGWDDAGAFIGTPVVYRDVKAAFDAAGYKGRPYVLRSYCDSGLLMAESANALSHAYRQFFMGHKGDIEHTYTVRKGQLSPDMLADMRGKYLGAIPYLCANTATVQTAPVHEQVREQVMTILQDVLGNAPEAQASAILKALRAAAGEGLDLRDVQRDAQGQVELKYAKA